jgi:hypothetical protein
MALIASSTACPLGTALADLLAEHPKVRADRLGFPADWRNRPLWQP